MKKNSWMLVFLRSILRKNKKRYALGIVSLSMGLTTLFLLFALKNGLSHSILPEILKRGDAYRFSLSKIVSNTSSHFLTIQQTVAPQREEIEYLKKYFPSMTIEYDFETLIPSYHSFRFANGEEKQGQFCAIKTCNEELLIEGRMWWDENEIVVNQKMQKELQKYLHKEDILGESIHYFSEVKIQNFLHDTSFSDTFTFHKKWTIVGVIQEFPLLSQATIYYSYDGMKSYLKNHYLRFYSIALGDVYSWYEWLEDFSSASKRSIDHLWLFIENPQDALRMMKLFYHSSLSHFLLESSTFQNFQFIQHLVIFIKSILLFLSAILAIITAITILYLTYTHYAEDHHQIGIILSLGMDRKSIAKFYAFQAKGMGMVSLFISILVFFLLSIITNAILRDRFAILHLLSFQRFGSLFLITSIGVSFLLYVVSFLPIYAARKREIDDYLKEE